VAGLLVAAVVAVLAGPALGADGDKAAARAHFEAATRLYDIHEYAKALEEYKEAYLAKPDPAFLFNVGQCYRKLGKLDKALDAAPAAGWTVVDMKNDWKTIFPFGSK